MYGGRHGPAQIKEIECRRCTDYLLDPSALGQLDIWFIVHERGDSLEECPVACLGLNSCQP